MTSRKVGSSSTTSTRTWREAPGVAWGFGVEFSISGVALRSGYCVKPFTVWAIDFGRRFNRTLVRCSPERKSQRGRGDVLACRTDHSPHVQENMPAQHHPAKIDGALLRLRLVEA